MGLVQNGYRLGMWAGRRMLGALTTIYNGGGDLHTFSSPNSVQRANYSTFTGYSAMPLGNLHPRAWQLPQKPGAMSMRPLGEGDLTADLIPSRAMSIDLTGSGDLEATGALVVSMAAAMTGSGTMSATIEGRLNMSCDLTGSGDLAADLYGIASMAIDILGEGDLEATIAAYGNMEIDIVVTGTGLSTANVGQAVWSSLLASYASSGNAAQALQTAGSGGVDYDALWASMPTALKESLADYVLAAAQSDPINSNVKEVNDVSVTGTGTTGDEWGPE